MTIASSGVMDINANASTTGSSVHLASSSKWSNYTFSATFNWIKGQTMGLIANYMDDDNYVVCEFDASSAGQVQTTLEQYMNGSMHVLGTGTDYVEGGVGESNIQASIEVQGTQETCSFNHHVTTSQLGATINPPYSGDIGFTTWDPTLNNSAIVVKSVDVKENY